MEQSYFGSEVAKVIGMSNSTVRKYCITLEEQGYKFHRGINNSRVFYNKDILMLQRIKRIMNSKNMTLKQAVDLAISSVEYEGVTTPVTVDEQADEQGMTYKEQIKRLEQMYANLAHQFQEQQRILFEREAKRDEQLTSAIREMQETKRLIAVTQEDKRKLKKKWYEFWK
ncbi:DUF3967 domain-containing protein [Priestia aryabhattai]|uniref:DUF3967 domain-containing protein n=1 Tax=Priestia aryabhattai TaxID=412384 RepID=UPI001CFC862C|nr:DUF3967 domain-containing protein [Priestia aryabhattai]